MDLILIDILFDSPVQNCMNDIMVMFFEFLQLLQRVLLQFFRMVSFLAAK